MFNDFWNRYSPLVTSDPVDRSTYTADYKTFKDKITSFFKWKADAILDEDQVKAWYYYSRTKWVLKLDEEQVNSKAHMYANMENFSDEKWVFFNLQRALFVSGELRQNNTFSYISEKDEVISKNIENIVLEISRIWKVWTKLLQSLLPIYIDRWYLLIHNIRFALLNYFKKEVERVFNRANSPLKAGYWIAWWPVYIVQWYHDIDHDLMDDEKFILAYWMKNWLLSKSEFNRVVEILSMWGDDLDYFYNNSYREDLFESYLNKILSK